ERALVASRRPADLRPGAEGVGGLLGGAVVGALGPRDAGPPLELGDLGGVGERAAHAEERLDVHAVVDSRGVRGRHGSSRGTAIAARACGRAASRKGRGGAAQRKSGQPQVETRPWSTWRRRTRNV